MESDYWQYYRIVGKHYDDLTIVILYAAYISFPIENYSLKEEKEKFSAECRSMYSWLSVNFNEFILKWMEWANITNVSFWCGWTAIHHIERNQTRPIFIEFTYGLKCILHFLEVFKCNYFQWVKSHWIIEIHQFVFCESLRKHIISSFNSGRISEDVAIFFFWNDNHHNITVLYGKKICALKNHFRYWNFVLYQQWIVVKANFLSFQNHLWIIIFIIVFREQHQILW